MQTQTQGIWGSEKVVPGKVDLRINFFLVACYEYLIHDTEH